MADACLWLSGLHGLPEEDLGKVLPRYWGRGHREHLAAQSSLEVAGRLLGFAGVLPAAALLAESEGIATAGYWVIALEPVAFLGQAGRAVVQPLAGLEESAAAALFSAAVEFLADSPWILQRGARRWYVLSQTTPDLHCPDPEQVWGREPIAQQNTGSDARRWNAFLNELQMFLAAHPVNQGHDGSEPWCLFWAWGEGRLPEQRPVSKWQTVSAEADYLQAAAAWLELPLSYSKALQAAAKLPDNLLWVWSGTWLYPDAAKSFAALEPALQRLWRNGGQLQCWTGILANGGVEQMTLSRGDRWRFWRKALRPGQASLPGAW
ncbi:hypothetical protein B1757_08140 [Acidithiobacillus marinus]|uniref:Phosphoglycerate mutase n=1 Tax=Acidithiobacillus marinus TaxID=187490 RepID=A0A2I1DL02_9PROT|nr:hypothetical protein [Acidithiobacillus marinus]PKY10544.1 hypothetical protein B1757_08140 [Acidithiobacillus marinus]